jgi:ADP-ribose pyrophosphatase
VPERQHFAYVEPWRKLEECVVYPGRRRVVARRFATSDGEQLDWEVKDEPDVATVLALTDEGEVILVRQFRVGPEEVLDELPGGAIDDGESPVAAARRELLEETGYVGDLRPVGEALDCAYSTRRRLAFVATGCRRVADPQPHAGEFVEVVRITLDAFRAQLRSGHLTDVAVGYLALDALDLL